ncbi:non-functional pseudokinase ZED1-like [Forsythia ovata]|uniref:Non-functional pseudokinase ZED1-like n=1 Tax=Forsythia ovata TaxID=205694 RepID=A0ABD1VM79_9LAMI
MNWTRKFSSFCNTRKEREDLSEPFLKNGSALLEELIVYFDGRYQVPIHNFKAEQVIRATENFGKQVFTCQDKALYRGLIQERQVLVIKYGDPFANSWTLNGSDGVEDLALAYLDARDRNRDLSNKRT